MKKAKECFAITLSVPLEMIIEWIGLEKDVQVYGPFTNPITRSLEFRLEHPSLPRIEPGMRPLSVCPYGPWFDEEGKDRLADVLRPNWSIREALAELAHEQWAGWMRYLFRFGMNQNSGTFVMDAEYVERWTRQMNTQYEDLPESEKNSDRAEADRTLGVFHR